MRTPLATRALWATLVIALTGAVVGEAPGLAAPRRRASSRPSRKRTASRQRRRHIRKGRKNRAKRRGRVRRSARRSKAVHFFGPTTTNHQLESPPTRRKADPCSPRYLPPFPGAMRLRSAYGGAKPGSFHFCPSWSGYGHVRGRGGHKYHGGVDISAPTGTPIRAAADGVLTYGIDPKGYGLFARLTVRPRVSSKHGSCRTGRPFEIIYAHLKDRAGKGKLWKSSRVRAGEIIGRVGCSGNARGMCSPSPQSHLHLTVQTRNRRRIRYDPREFFGWKVHEPTHKPGSFLRCLLSDSHRVYCLHSRLVAFPTRENPWDEFHAHGQGFFSVGAWACAYAPAPWLADVCYAPASKPFAITTRWIWLVPS